MKKQRHIDLGVHSSAYPYGSVLSPSDIIRFTIADGADSAAVINEHIVRDFEDLYWHSDSQMHEKEICFKPIYGVKISCCSDENRTFRITLLAQNKTGLKNIYRIISCGDVGTGRAVPYPIANAQMLAENREGILIGLECDWYSIADDMKVKDILADAELIRADYAEFFPWSQRTPADLICDPEHDLSQTAVSLADHFRSAGILPVAVSNANCITQDDAIARSVLPYSEGTPDVFMKTTEQMLEEFSYLGGELAEQAVLENPEQIASKITQFDPRNYDFSDTRFQIQGAKAYITEQVWEAARKKYGEIIPPEIEKRIESEFERIDKEHLWPFYQLRKEMSDRCKSRGFHFISTDAVGSTLAAYLLGITKCNPLPRHRYCPNCRQVFFDDLVQTCPQCGSATEADGFHCEPESFFGGYYNNPFDLSFCLSADGQKDLEEYLAERFGSTQVALQYSLPEIEPDIIMNSLRLYEQESGKSLSFWKKRDLLLDRINHPLFMKYPSDACFVISYENQPITEFAALQPVLQGERKRIRWVTQLEMVYFPYPIISAELNAGIALAILERLEKYTAIPADSIDFRAIDFTKGLQKMQLTGLDFPFLSYKRHYQRLYPDFRIRNFDELVQAFSYDASGHWYGAEPITEETLPTAICSRDDIILLLTSHGISMKGAHHAAMEVSYGQGGIHLNDSRVRLLRQHGIPQSSIDSMKKIERADSRAEAVEEAVLFAQLVWYKQNNPTAFFAAVLSELHSGKYVWKNSDYSIFSKKPARLYKELTQLEEELVPKATIRAMYRTHGVTYDEIHDHRCARLRLVLDCIKRGIHFLPPDKNAPDCDSFVPVGGDIRLPFREEKNP